MSECPGNTADAKPAGYSRVFIDVTRIVVVNEVVPERLAENNPGKRYKKDANANAYPEAACFTRSD